MLELDLTENRLRFEDFDYLLHINKLNISSNDMSEPDIRSNTLPNLISLDISFNGLVPQQAMKVKEFTRLKELSLVGNNLSSVPPALTELANLETLNLSHN